MSALGEYALEYALQRLRLLPLHHIDEEGCCSCGRACGRDAAKHPDGRLVPKGLTNATNDPRRVERYWRQEPEANIGIVTSGIAVLDVDPRNGGEATLANRLAEYGALPDTPTVATGGGGLHYYFRAGAAGLRCTKLGDGLDLKADGGYVVAPPSIHACGREYTWLVPFKPSALAPLPGWVQAHAATPTARPCPTPLAHDDPLLEIPTRAYIEALAEINTGTRSKIRCPLPDHDDRTPSFHIYPSAAEGWFCFGCRRGGGIYQFAGLLGGYQLPLRAADFLTVQDALFNFYERVS